MGHFVLGDSLVLCETLQKSALRKAVRVYHRIVRVEKPFKNTESSCGVGSAALLSLQGQMGSPELVGWCLQSVSERTCHADTGDRYKTWVCASKAGRTAGQLGQRARHLPRYLPLGGQCPAGPQADGHYPAQRALFPSWPVRFVSNGFHGVSLSWKANVLPSVLLINFFRHWLSTFGSWSDTSKKPKKSLRKLSHMASVKFHCVS